MVIWSNANRVMASVPGTMPARPAIVCAKLVNAHTQHRVQRLLLFFETRCVPSYAEARCDAPVSRGTSFPRVITFREQQAWKSTGGAALYH